LNGLVINANAKTKGTNSRPKSDNRKSKTKKFGLKVKAKDYHHCPQFTAVAHKSEWRQNVLSLTCSTIQLKYCDTQFRRYQYRWGDDTLWYRDTRITTLQRYLRNDLHQFYSLEQVLSVFPIFDTVTTTE